jgi:hypothetical protein
VFTGIKRKFIMVILSEENQENLRGLEGGLCSLALKENLYW